MRLCAVSALLFAVVQFSTATAEEAPTPTPLPTENYRLAPAETCSWLTTDYATFGDLNEGECSTAAAALGYSYRGSLCRTASKYPRGCYVLMSGSNAGEATYNSCNGGGICDWTRNCICKEVEPPTPFPTVDAPYKTVEAETCAWGTTASPPETYATVLSASDCKVAAEALGFTYTGSKCRRNRKYPSGCYVLTEGNNINKASWNTCGGGGTCDWVRNCICRETTPYPTLNPTTFASRTFIPVSESTCEAQGYAALGPSDCEAAANTYASNGMETAAGDVVYTSYAGKKRRNDPKYPPRGCYVVTGIDNNRNGGKVVYQKKRDNGRVCTEARNCICTTKITPRPTVSPTFAPTIAPPSFRIAVLVLGSLSFAAVLAYGFLRQRIERTGAWWVSPVVNGLFETAVFLMALLLFLDETGQFILGDRIFLLVQTTVMCAMELTEKMYSFNLPIRVGNIVVTALLFVASFLAVFVDHYPPDAAFMLHLLDLLFSALSILLFAVASLNYYCATAREGGAATQVPTPDATPHHHHHQVACVAEALPVAQSVDAAMRELEMSEQALALREIELRGRRPGRSAAAAAGGGGGGGRGRGGLVAQVVTVAPPPSAPAPKELEVYVPPGTVAGSTLVFADPDTGRQIEALVPQDYPEGGTIKIPV